MNEFRRLIKTITKLQEQIGEELDMASFYEENKLNNHDKAVSMAENLEAQGFSPHTIVCVLRAKFGLERLDAIEAYRQGTLAWTNAGEE